MGWVKPKLWNDNCENSNVVWSFTVEYLECGSYSIKTNLFVNT
jgi:hypothetical protein